MAHSHSEASVPSWINLIYLFIRVQVKPQMDHIISSISELKVPLGTTGQIFDKYQRNISPDMLWSHLIKTAVSFVCKKNFHFEKVIFCVWIWIIDKCFLVCPTFLKWSALSSHYCALTFFFAFIHRNGNKVENESNLNWSYTFTCYS